MLNLFNVKWGKSEEDSNRGKDKLKDNNEELEKLSDELKLDKKSSLKNVNLPTKYLLTGSLMKLNKEMAWMNLSTLKRLIGLSWLYSPSLQVKTGQ